MARPRIVLIGGGSVLWAPTLLRDILAKEALRDADVRLLDCDRDAVELMAQVGGIYAKALKAGATFLSTTDAARALDGADFVVITVSTGGLDAMEKDLRIPERYGIFHTVGDTVGPGGWSRSLRNIPVFLGFAREFSRRCPRAFILNYTNPMASLTAALAQSVSQPVVGLCHGLFENLRLLRSVFGLDSETQLDLRYAGVNHFFWVLDFTVHGRPGYPWLRRKLTGGKRLDDLLAAHYRDAAGHASLHRRVATELFETYGLLPYLGDRHTCEFFGRYIAPDRARLATYKLERTTIGWRRTHRRRGRRAIADLLAGRSPLDLKPSRETAADLIEAAWNGRPFTDVMNLPNIGQIPNLPRGAVVETPGVVTSSGFSPIHVGALPPAVQTLVAPHAINQQLIVEASLRGDRSMALQALANDPACAHLTLARVRELGDSLIKAHRAFLPHFCGRYPRRGRPSV